MKHPQTQFPGSSIPALLESARKRGVRLWAENGRLHYRAPKGALTPPEIEELRLARARIIAHLELVASTGEVEPALVSHQDIRRSPLAYSQLAHWNSYRLGTRAALRQISSATRLCGPLDLHILQESINVTVRRHDALRTTVPVLAEGPVQQISEKLRSDLLLEDLTAMSDTDREAEIISAIEQLILEPIDAAAGPLFGVRLLKLHDSEHVLIVAMEHMISDEVSMKLFLRDLFSTYTQLVQGRIVSLPPISVQFADFAARQRTNERLWVDQHSAYWSGRLATSERMRFPEDRVIPVGGAHEGWGSVSLKIDEQTRSALVEWSRAQRTTVAMSVFVAYVAVVLKWCKTSDGLIQYQFNGRDTRGVENTIGYFASALYLRVVLRDDDSFLDLLGRVTEEYCSAYEHADASYMAAQTPRPEFTRNTLFNWIPEIAGQVELKGTEGSLTCSPILFEHPMLKRTEIDHEPSILLYDAGKEIVGGMCFPRNRFSAATMERFQRNLLLVIAVLLRRPEENVRSICFT